MWDRFNYASTEVVLHIRHGKTDKHGNFTPLDIVLPHCGLSMLLVAHIAQGQELLVANRGPVSPEVPTNLFVSRYGNGFSDQTFSQWWSGLLARTGMPHFPAVMARTSFVMDYTGKYGVDPNMWDGAAAIMGNSVATMKACYNPLYRQNKAKEVVATYEAYVEKRKRQRRDAGVAGEEAEEED